MKRCRFVEVVVTRCLGFWVDHDALSALWAPYPGVQDRIATEHKCGNISISSLGTKISDIQVDSRVPSPPDLRFRSSPPSVVAERIPVMCNQSQPGLSARMNVQPITNEALKAALTRARRRLDARRICRLWADDRLYRSNPCGRKTGYASSCGRRSSPGFDAKSVVDGGGPKGRTSSYQSSCSHAAT